MNEALIETVESCTPEQWRAVCADTGWTVAVQAHHIAVNFPVIAGIIGSIAAGHPLPPVAAETIDAINARHAEESAGVTQAEVVDLLCRNGAEAAAGYRMLTDAQLARSATVQLGRHETSAEQLLTYLAIGEIENHGEHLRAAMSR